MREKRRRDRATSDARKHQLLAALDELDVIDEVLRALPSVRRLLRSASSREPESDVLADAADDHDRRRELDQELLGVDDALIELVRWRLRLVANAVRSMRDRR